MNETASDPIAALLDSEFARRTRLVKALRESFTETELMALEILVDGEYRDMDYQKRMRRALREAHGV